MTYAYSWNSMYNWSVGPPDFKIVRATCNAAQQWMATKVMKIDFKFRNKYCERFPSCQGHNEGGGENPLPANDNFPCMDSRIKSLRFGNSSPFVIPSRADDPDIIPTIYSWCFNIITIISLNMKRLSCSREIVHWRDENLRLV